MMEKGKMVIMINQIAMGCSAKNGVVAHFNLESGVPVKLGEFITLSSAYVGPHGFNECRFHVVGSNGAWYLKADGENERDLWIQALQRSQVGTRVYYHFHLNPNPNLNMRRKNLLCTFRYMATSRFVGFISLPKELKAFVLRGKKLVVNFTLGNNQAPWNDSLYNLPPKGKFILNIIEFAKEEDKRLGAWVDSYNLVYLLHGLGYRIFPNVIEKTEEKTFSEMVFYLFGHQRWTKEVIQTELQQFKEKCIEDKVQSIIVFIGSHGFNDILLTSDQKYLDVYDEIMHLFNFRVGGKPIKKMFINQSCQYDPPRDCNPRVNNSLPEQSIYVKAQMPRYPASRDTVCGSYFMIVFVYVLMSRAWNTSLKEMLEQIQTLLEEVSTAVDESAYQFSPFTIKGLDEPFHFFL